MTELVKRKGIVLMLISLLISSFIPGNVYESNAFEEEEEFESCRLIAVDKTGELLNNESVVGNYEDVFLLMYDTPEETKEAYDSLVEKMVNVEEDYKFVIAEERNESEYENGNKVQDEDEDVEAAKDSLLKEDFIKEESVNDALENNNSLRELDNLISEIEDEASNAYDIAIIDTGSIYEDSNISVIGDAGFDINGHGTAMYDSIKAIYPDSKILSIKAINDDGEGDLSAVYSAIKLAIEMNVKVINLSISAKRNGDCFLIDEVIEEAIQKGIAVVGAAGNGGIDAEETIPGSIKGVYVVGSCDEYGNVKDYSNYGETVDFYIQGKTTSYSAAKASAYIALTGGTEGIEEFFIKDGFTNNRITEDMYFDSGHNMYDESSNSDYLDYDTKDNDDYIDNTSNKENEKNNLHISSSEDLSNKERDNDIARLVSEEEVAEVILSESDEDFVKKELEQYVYDSEISVVVKYLLVDESQVDDSDTFNSVMIDKMAAPVKLQFAETGKAYLDDNGDYRVATNTPFVNGIASGLPLDVSFANGNDNGESITDGVYFDDEKMMAVISNDALGKYEGDFSDIQIQIMVPTSLDNTKIHVKVLDEKGVEAAESGIYEANPWWNYEMQLMNINKAGEISQGDISVFVNGDEIRIFEYDKKTGILRLPIDSIRIKNVEIHIKETGLVEKIKKTMFSTAYPTMSKWLELDEGVDVSKFTEGKTFSQKCLHVWSAEGYHPDFRGGAGNYDKFAPESKTFDVSYVKSGDLPESVSKGATNQELMTGAIAIPTNFYGIKNFVLHGKTNGNNDSSTVISGGKEYNYGLWGFCYHIDVANDQDLKEKTINFEVMDVSKKQDDYTYITMAYMLIGGRNSDSSYSNIDQTTGGYFGFRVKNTTVESDYTNLSIIKRAKNAKDQSKIVDDYATFKTVWTGTGSYAGQNRTWYFKTIDGEANLNRSANLDNDYKNDEMFIEDNKVYYPPGKLTITEERVPKGFNSSDVTLTATITERKTNNKTVYDIDWDNATKKDISVEYLGKEKIENSLTSKISINLFNYEQMDSTNLVIQKIDGTTLKPIEDDNPATFKVEYFRMNPNNWDGTDNNLNEPERTWYFKTLTGEKDELKGVINFNRPANLNIDYDNDELFWYDKYHVGYPEGVLRVTEELAPKGYSKSNVKMYAVVTNTEVDGKVVYKTRWTENTKTINGVKYIGYTKPYETSQAFADQISFENNTKGKLKIIKSSKNPEITTNNQSYKLSGAEFSIYRSKEDAEKDINKLDTLITDDSGTTKESKELTVGTYWVKETKAPEGYGLSKEIVSIEVKSGNKNSVEFADEPLYAIPKLVRKTSLTNGRIIENDYAVFKVMYSDKSEKNSLTWYFKTKNGILDLSDSNLLADGYKQDKLFMFDNQVIYPLGSYSITEEKAPKGYIKNESELEGMIYEKEGKAFFKWETVANGVISFDEKDGSAIFANQPKPIEIKTVAFDMQTGSHTGVASKDTRVSDRVKFKNLEIGSKYRFEGILKDATSGMEIAKSTMTYTAKESDGEIIMPEFKYDASKLMGRTLVITENLWNEDVNKIVAKHDSLTEENQMIYYPRVRTMALDSETKTHSGVIGEKSIIVDTVSLDNLAIGETYKIVGKLMYSDGHEFIESEEPIIEESEEFIAEEKSIKKNMVFTFDSSLLEGKSLVVFEKLLVKSEMGSTETDEGQDTSKSWTIVGWTEVANHEDIDDQGQTIDYIQIGTSALDSLTETNVGSVREDTIIVDRVNYKNLRLGEEYTVKGTLRYKNDFVDANGQEHFAGETIINTEGKPYSAEETFKAEKKNGYVDLIYHVNSLDLSGQSIVVFEDLYTKNINIASHSDLEDEDQTIDFPEVRTTAISRQTGDHIGDTEEETIIVDNVELINLRVGEKYKVYGILMDKDSGEPVMDNEGNLIESFTEEFEATEENMNIDMEFILDGKMREDLTTVVFEDLIHKDIVVATHRNIEDEKQSIYTPKVRTKAVDTETNNHVGRPRKGVTILDTVSLHNLIVGMVYTVEGVLMEKGSGKYYLDDKGNEVYSQCIFVADSKDMDIEMPFTFDGENLSGKTIVVFENLIHNDVVVASHSDLEDLEQSIDYPDGRTEARDSKTETNIADPSETTTIIDTVYFENLKEGLEYTVEGVLMDKSSGQMVMENNKPITNTVTFIPETKDGAIEIPFTFNSNVLKGKSLVAFETMKHEDVDVFIHHDINSKEQTVSINNPSTPNVPKTSPKVPTTVPRTGDFSSILISIVLIEIAILGILIVIKNYLDEEID